MMSEAQASVQDPKVIKRYTNRKLYDTIESRYVTLDEIAEMVKQGLEVKIVDNRSKEDLTSVTLAQIVFEEEKKKSQMPLSMLRDIIRRPTEQLSEFISAQVGPRVDALKQEAGQRIEWILGRDGGGADHSPAALLQQSQKVVEAWQGRVDERVKAAVESVVGNLPALGSDLTALLRRLEQLEQKVAEFEKRKPPEPT
jgi:polyhydroxyalkanoate synthesis repressor PhaR